MDVLSSKIQSVVASSKDYLYRLATVWRDLGLCEEQRQRRRDEFERHLIKEHTELLSAMVEEEEKMKQKVIADVADYKIELDNLCSEMKRTCDMVSVEARVVITGIIIANTIQPNEDLPLVAKVKFLKSKVDSLRTVSLKLMLKVIYFYSIGETRAYKAAETFGRNGGCIV